MFFGRNVGRYCGRNRLHLDSAGDPLGRGSNRQALAHFLGLFVGEGASSAGPSGRDHAGINRGNVLGDRGSSACEQGQYFFGLLFFKGLLFGLLNRCKDT